MSKKLFLLVFSTLLRNPHIAQDLDLDLSNIVALLLSLAKTLPILEFLNSVQPELSDVSLALLA